MMRNLTFSRRFWNVKHLLLQFDDGILCLIRLAQCSSVSWRDPSQLGLVAKQEEHEEEDGRDGGSPGQVDVQVDRQEAVGVEKPGQLFALLDENIVVDQLLQCGQHTGFGHGKAGEGGRVGYVNKRFGRCLGGDGQRETGGAQAGEVRGGGGPERDWWRAKITFWRNLD